MIDKLGLSMLNFDKSGKSDFAEGSEKYYQNQLIKDYITLLIDPRSQHILHRPIDNDTKLLKDVLKEIELTSGIQEMPYGFYSLSTQTERKDDYITGKIGIGPFALNNNNHILTMLYGVKFKDFPDSIMSSLGLTDLSGNRDQDGLSIMSWLSALINAHVDIAKDPYISRLNVGPFTYNLVNTLIRTGFGKKTFYLTTQPIMKELAIAYNRASSLYMQDSNKSTWKLLQEAVEEAAKNRFENVKIGDWTFDLLVQGVSDLKDTKYRSKINTYIKALFESDAFKNNANKEYDACEGVSIHVGKDDDFSDKAFLHLDADQVQLLVYLSYLQMDPYAQSVSNLVKFSKIDTKKHGKSYIEQLVFWRGFNDLFYNPTGTGLFEETGLRRMAEESYIRLKTDNAISMTKAILKDQFLQSSNAFDNAILVVLNMIQRPDSKSVDLWTDIANILSASVKSEFIVNQYAKTLPQYNSTYIRDLISESEDDLEFTQEVNSNRLKVIGNSKYDLKSYVGGAVTMKFVQDGENREYTFNIIGYDDETNELIVDYNFKREHTGSMHIVGGKNTIYDRFMSLYLDLKDDPAYNDMLDIAGEPVNYLLKSLTAGKTFTYNKVNELDYITKHEAPDTYPTAKFVKLFNALDQNGPETNYIIDAWDQLLHDERHPKLKQFAEDLVVYSFITSGDKGGFTKFFKQVPLSWRIESGYADYIYDKLAEFKTQEIPTEQLEDAILNNWFDYQFVPTYQLATDGKPNFITYFNNSPSTGIARANYPTIVAALRQESSGSVTPTIDADNAPMYIKIPRRKEKEARDSQRRYTIYKLLSYGMLRSALHGTDEKGNPVTWYEWVHYPIYVKVEPKGNLLTQNYLITEYMREDSTNKEYAPNQETLRGLYKLGDFISQSTIEQYKPKYGEMLTLIIQDMNYQDVFEERFASNESDFDKAVRRASRSDNPEDYQMQSGGANGADTVWGEIAKEFGVTKQNHWYYQEKTPNGNVEISQQDYEEGRYKVAEAAKMNWGYQYKTMKDSRLIRNWALVKYADSVFAIGHLVNTGEKLFSNQQDDTRTALVPAVQGGTGYAVGMAILNKVPVYVFDQERNQWFANIGGEWKRVDTPVLTERFAGIGTRQINDAGKQAIRDVFEKTFNKQKLTSVDTNRTDNMSLSAVDSTVNKKSVWEKATSSYTRNSVQNDPTTLYIFTDNTDRTSGGQEYGDGWYKLKYGSGGFGSMNNPTTAQIRGLENAAPISTMRYFYRAHQGMSVELARWKDSDIEEFKKVIDSEIEDIKKLWDSGKFTKIVSPSGDGFFNSKIAQISKNSKIGEYLDGRLRELYNYVNQDHVISTHTPKVSVKPLNLLFGRRAFGEYGSKFVAGELVVGEIDDLPFNTEKLNKIDSVFLNVEFVNKLDLDHTDSETHEEKSQDKFTTTENVSKAEDLFGDGLFDTSYSWDGNKVLKDADTLAKYMLQHEEEFHFVSRLADDFTVMNDMINDFVNGRKPMSIFDAIYEVFSSMDNSEIGYGNNIQYSYRVLPTEGELFSGFEYSEAEALMKEAEEIKEFCKGGK